VLWLISLSSPAVAWWVGLSATILFLVVLVVHLILMWLGDREKRIEARTIVFSTAVLTMGVLFYMLVAPASNWSAGFSKPDDAGVWQWVLFFLDNTFSIVLLDLPEVFDIHISSIKPDYWAARLLTALVRFLIAIGVIELVVRLYRSRYQREEFFCTV